MASVDRLLRSNLKLKHLQLLVALDQFHHLGQAAEFLSLTQPAVSKMLAEVERQFGATLFDRSTKGTQPTAQGAVVVRFARSVLVGLDRTRHALTLDGAGLAEHVDVGVMVVALSSWLAPAVAALKNGNPHVTIGVEEGDLTRLLPRLRQGELNLIIGRLEPGHAAPDLKTEALAEESMVLIVAPDHPLALQTRPSWRDLPSYPWVLPPAWASSRAKLIQALYRRRLPAPIDVIETASHLATMTFVRQRLSIGFVARGVATEAVRQGLVKVLPIALPIELPPIGLIVQRDRPLQAGAQRLIEHLRRLAER
jgi:DNA-binding transcriptional LysR family regulator